jgi:hypothetical protein
MQLNLNPNSLDYLIEDNIVHYPLLLCLNMSNEIINYIIKNQDKLRHFTSTMPKLPFTIDNICEYLFNWECNMHYTQGVLLNARYISLIEKNLILLNNSNINILYANSAALHLVDLNPHVIDWKYLSCNTNPIAIQILKENIDFWDEESCIYQLIFRNSQCWCHHRYYQARFVVMRPLYKMRSRETRESAQRRRWTDSYFLLRAYWLT